MLAYIIAADSDASGGALFPTIGYKHYQRVSEAINEDVGEGERDMKDAILNLLLLLINARLRIGRVCGVLVTLNYSFVAVLMVAVAYSNFGYDYKLLFWLMLLGVGIVGSFLLHEIGHAVVGRLFGVNVREIGILPIGGYTIFDGGSDSKWSDVCISLAGPLCNMMACVGLIATELALVDGGLSERLRIIGEQLFDNEFVDDTLLFLWADTVLRVNLILFVVNLLPALPLDGGRVFRGLLTTALTERRSALITVIVSRVISIGMVMYTLCGAIIGTGSVADVLIQLPISALIWWACRTDDVGTENDDQIDSATFPCGIIDDSPALNIAISTQNAECEYVLH